jgi:hypothetical protein
MAKRRAMKMRVAQLVAQWNNMICIVSRATASFEPTGRSANGGGLWRKKWLLDHERRSAKMTRESINCLVRK